MSQEVAVELFRHIDKDGSGFITYTELSKALANVRLPKPVPKEYADSEDMTELTGEELEAALAAASESAGAWEARAADALEESRTAREALEASQAELARTKSAWEAAQAQAQLDADGALVQAKTEGEAALAQARADGEAALARVRAELGTRLEAEAAELSTCQQRLAALGQRFEQVTIELDRQRQLAEAAERREETRAANDAQALAAAVEARDTARRECEAAMAEAFRGKLAEEEAVRTSTRARHAADAAAMDADEARGDMAASRAEAAEARRRELAKAAADSRAVAEAHAARDDALLEASRARAAELDAKQSVAEAFLRASAMEVAHAQALKAAQARVDEALGEGVRQHGDVVAAERRAEEARASEREARALAAESKKLEEERGEEVGRARRAEAEARKAADDLRIELDDCRRRDAARARTEADNTARAVAEAEAAHAEVARVREAAAAAERRVEAARALEAEAYRAKSETEAQLEKAKAEVRRAEADAERRVSARGDMEADALAEAVAARKAAEAEAGRMRREAATARKDAEARELEAARVAAEAEQEKAALRRATEEIAGLAAKLFEAQEELSRCREAKQAAERRAEEERLGESEARRAEAEARRAEAAAKEAVEAARHKEEEAVAGRDAAKKAAEHAERAESEAWREAEQARREAAEAYEKMRASEARMQLAAADADEAAEAAHEAHEEMYDARDEARRARREAEEAIEREADRYRQAAEAETAARTYAEEVLAYHTSWSITRAPLVHPRAPNELSSFHRPFACVDPADASHKRRREELFASFAVHGRAVLTLSDVQSGVMATLSKAYGRAAIALYRRYYKSYAYAFSAAIEASALRTGRPLSKGGDASRPRQGEVLSRSQFRLLLVYLGVYATWYEVFAYVIDVGGPRGSGSAGLRSRGAGADGVEFVRIEVDHHVSRGEWQAFAVRVREAGRTWAPYIRLREASAHDFDTIASWGKERITFSQFAAWLKSAEQAAGTPIGHELLGDPLTPSFGLHGSPQLDVSMRAASDLDADGEWLGRSERPTPRGLRPARTPRSPAPRAAMATGSDDALHRRAGSASRSISPPPAFDEDADDDYDHEEGEMRRGGLGSSRGSRYSTIGGRSTSPRSRGGGRLDLRAARRDLSQILEY